MKRIVALLFLTLCSASLCWGQYNDARARGITDGTSLLSSYNAWKLLPGGGVCPPNKPNPLAISPDGFGFCIGTDNHVYSYNFQTHGPWTQIPAMGTANVGLAAESSTSIYTLQPTGFCTANRGSNSYGVFHWDGTSFTQPDTTICLVEISVDGDGVIVGVMSALAPSPYTSTAWWSTNGGSTYNRMASTTSGWTWVSRENTTTCAIQNESTVYTFDDTTGGFTQLSTQPVNAGVAPMTGCLVADNSILVWEPVQPQPPVRPQIGVQRYDLTTATWSSVVGGGQSYVAAYGLATTFALNATGNPLHLNVYPGFASAQVTGSFSGCPIQPCTNTATHTFHVGMAFPHGVRSGGVLANNEESLTTSPTINVNVNAFDFSFTCDPFFGDPSDPECQAAALEQAHCDVSGSNFVNNTSPSPCTNCGTPSFDNVAWDGGTVGESDFHFGNEYIVALQCSHTQHVCQPGTVAVCDASPASYFGANAGGTSTISQADAKKKALAECDQFSVTHVNPSTKTAEPGSWEVASSYDPKTGAKSCSAINWWRTLPGRPCK